MCLRHTDSFCDFAVMRGQEVDLRFDASVVFQTCILIIGGGFILMAFYTRGQNYLRNNSNKSRLMEYR